MNAPCIKTILATVKFRNWSYLLEYDGPRPYLVIEFVEDCNVTGQPSLQRSRKWFLSQHMTRSEIVQTAFKATLTAMEHEVREQFFYKDAAIFGPHFDVESLHFLATGGKPDIRPHHHRVGCAACDRGDYQLGHHHDCPKASTSSTSH